MHSALFVPDQDVAYTGLMEFVVEGEDGPTRISEADLHLVRLQQIHKQLGSRFFHMPPPNEFCSKFPDYTKRQDKNCGLL
jgi:hypothetical protein